MKVWLDAQLPPALCRWLRAEFDIEAEVVRDLGLRDAEDLVIFEAARDAGAVVMSKDADFVDLVSLHGPPPQILWVTFGNTSNRAIRRLLTTRLPEAIRLLESGEPLVELSASR